MQILIWVVELIMLSAILYILIQDKVTNKQTPTKNTSTEIIPVKEVHSLPFTKGSEPKDFVVIKYNATSEDDTEFEVFLFVDKNELINSS